MAVLPIRVFGDPVLRAETQSVDAATPELQAFIDSMIETMHGADGIGLAAPQVGRPLRIFVVDLSPMKEDVEEDDGPLPPQPMVFVNPEIVAESDEDCDFEEGCLSIPDVRERVVRPQSVRIRYQDRHLEPRELEATGFLARVVQHEYDHLEGVLFTDYLTAFRKQMLRRRLKGISQGDVEADYPLALPKSA